MRRKGLHLGCRRRCIREGLSHISLLNNEIVFIASTLLVLAIVHVPLSERECLCSSPRALSMALWSSKVFLWEDKGTRAKVSDKGNIVDFCDQNVERGN